MVADPKVDACTVSGVRYAVGGCALLLAVVLLASCGSSQPQTVVTGSTTTCVPMGTSISCSCTPITQSPHGS